MTDVSVAALGAGLLASEPADFAAQHGVRLHEVAQTVAQASLAYMKTFPLETSPDWFGHLVIEDDGVKVLTRLQL